MIPRRRKAPKMQVKESGVIRCPGHRKFVRGFTCVVDNSECAGRIEAAHARVGTGAGVGIKPGDNWVFPCCASHHAEQHRVGEITFEKKHKLRLKDIAAALWKKSPHYRTEENAPDPAR